MLADGGPESRYAYIRLTDQMLVNHFRDRGLLSPPSERKNCRRRGLLKMLLKWRADKKLSVATH